MALEALLRRMELSGDPAAELDRWIDARDLTADEALRLLLDVPVESAELRESILTWYLRRSGATPEPSPLAVQVAAALLTAALPGEEQGVRLLETVAREHARAGAAAPAWVRALTLGRGPVE